MHLLTPSEIKYGYVKLRVDDLGMFRNFGRTGTVKVKLGDVEKEVHFDEHSRLRGVKKWYDRNRLRTGDTIIIEILSPEQIRLSLKRR
jgi:hypothetical protein